MSLKPGDTFSTGGDFHAITSGVERDDGSWTHNQNDPNLAPYVKAAFGQAKGSKSSGKGGGK